MASLGRAIAPRRDMMVDTVSDASARGPSAFEWLFAAFALITYQGAFFPILHKLRGGGDAVPGWENTEFGDPVARYAQLVIILVTAILCVLRWKHIVPVMRLIWPFWVFIALCMASALWSDSPMLSFRRSVSLLGCFLFGSYAYYRFGAQRFIYLVALIGGISAFSSLVLLLVNPSLAYDSTYFETSAIRGVYAQKNSLSAYNTIGLCASIAIVFLERYLSPSMKVVMATLSFLMLLTLMLSRGMSAVAAFVLMFLVFLIYFDRISWRARLLLAYLFMMVLILGAFMLYVDPTGSLSLVGKDTTLTGRWEVWTEALRAIRLKPILGFGYDSFWDPTLSRTRYVWHMIGWAAPNAHSGYLELLLGVGTVGTVLYVFMCARATVLAVRLARFNIPGMRWFVMYSMTVFVLNLDEGTLALPDAIAVQVAFGCCLVEASLRSQRFARAEAAAAATALGA